MVPSTQGTKFTSCHWFFVRVPPHTQETPRRSTPTRLIPARHHHPTLIRLGWILSITGGRIVILCTNGSVRAAARTSHSRIKATRFVCQQTYSKTTDQTTCLSIPSYQIAQLRIP